MSSPTREIADQGVCRRCGTRPHSGALGPWDCSGCNEAAQRRQAAAAELRAWKQYNAGSDYR